MIYFLFSFGWQSKKLSGTHTFGEYLYYRLTKKSNKNTKCIENHTVLVARYD